MTSINQEQQADSVRRVKPRMSASERRQLKKTAALMKKLSTGQAIQQSVTSTDEEDHPPSSEMQFVESPSPVAETGQEIEEEEHPIIVTKRSSELLTDLARQLSDASNFVAQRCVETRNEDGARVQK